MIILFLVEFVFLAGNDSNMCVISNSVYDLWPRLCQPNNCLAGELWENMLWKCYIELQIKLTVFIQRDAVRIFSYVFYSDELYSGVPLSWPYWGVEKTFTKDDRGSRWWMWCQISNFLINIVLVNLSCR